MRISREATIYAFDKNAAPVCSVRPPCHLVFETRDALNGQVTDENMRIDHLDFNRVNPATGPVLVEGAEPGDALCLHIKELRLDTRGVMITAPGAGLLPDVVTGKSLVCTISGHNFTFKGVKLPLSPMIGVIGVAPAGDGIACGVPGSHGGNMDTAGINAGALLYLPVFVPGALLALGDLHAAMGDGEVSVSGVEVAGEVSISLTLEKNRNLPCPLLKTGKELAFLASAEDTDTALALSTRHMHTLLAETTTLDADEALMLMSACGQARISQVVDPLKTSRFCMPLDVLKKFGVPQAF